MGAARRKKETVDRLAGASTLQSPNIQLEPRGAGGVDLAPASPNLKYDDGEAAKRNTPPTPPGQVKLTRFPPWLVIGVWIALSTSVILVNREILMGSSFNFPYPITLTTLHLLFQTAATRILHRYTNLIAPPSSDYSPLPTSDYDGASDRAARATQAKAAAVEMDWVTWRKQILPPALLFSVSLVLSNWAYLYLTVSYIHMLKAFSPVAILLAAFAFGTKAFSVKLVVIVCVISLGTGLASYGESAFSMTGFLIQATAIAVEATRVTLIQLLLAGQDMSPLKTLYYFAPICLLMNSVLIIPFEGLRPLSEIPSLGFSVIIGNCILTFLLNLSAVYLIGLSSMVLSLSKVVKDVMLVGGSTLFLGERLTPLQGVGYAIATIGLLWYKVGSN